ATAEKPAPRRFGGAVAGVALIAVMAFGIHRRMELLALAIGAAGFGLFVLGTAWMVFAIVFYVLDALVAAMAAPVFRPRREVVTASPPLREPVPEIEIPVRSPEEIEAEAQERYDQQQRRDDARMRCDLYYNLHETELSCFEREHYQSYVDRYLSD